MCKCSLVYEGGRGSAPGCLGAGQDRRSPDLGQYREWMAGERKMNLRPQGQESRSPVSENRDRLSSGEARCRSEEHTSELQSLMRISYAVFCLQKKNTLITHLSTN